MTLKLTVCSVHCECMRVANLCTLLVNFFSSVDWILPQLFGVVGSMHISGSFYYRPQRSWAKVIFLHLSVILLTGGCTWSGLRGCTWSGPGGGTWSGGVCQVPPQTRHPPGPGTPPGDQVPLLDQTPPLGPGTPPRTRHPPDQTPPRPDTPPEQQTLEYGLRAAGMHPTGMHSCCWKYYILNKYNYIYFFVENQLITVIIYVFTGRQWSWGKVMFSVMSACSQGWVQTCSHQERKIIVHPRF